MKKNRLRAGLAGVLLLTAVGAAQAQSVLTIADFDIPHPNQLGGGYGAFSPKAEEAVFVTVETMDSEVKHGESGSSMRLEYNVGKAGAFNGFWMKLGGEDIANNFDGSKFTKLTFWIKGDTAVGVPRTLKIELKGDPGTPLGRAYIKDIGNEWKKIELPLADYANQRVDLTKLNEIVLVFENAQAAPGIKGVIWVDDFKFE